MLGCRARARDTERLKFLLALRPGFLTPALAARQSAAFDRISNGRLLLNIVTGGSPKELAGDGLFLDHDERYAQTDEFLTIWRGLLDGGQSTSTGRHLTARKARARLFRQRAEAVSAAVVRRLVGRRHRGRGRARRHLSDLGRAARRGRREAGRSARRVPPRAAARCEFGLRRASDRARDRRRGLGGRRRLISQLSDETIAAAQAQLREDADSVGQRRTAALAWRPARQAGGQPESVGRRRPGARTASAPRWSAARRQSPHGCASTRRSASRRSSRRAIRIWRRPIASPNCCSRSSGIGSRRRAGARDIATGLPVELRHRRAARSGGRGMSEPCGHRQPRAAARSWLGWPSAASWSSLAGRRLCAFGLHAGQCAAGADARSPRRAGGSRSPASCSRNIEVSAWRALAGFAIGGGIGFALGIANGLSRAQRDADRQHAADGPQHPASGADPAGDPVVRHRRGGEAVPGRARRVLPDLRQHAARRPLGRSATDGDGPRLRHDRLRAVPARGAAGRAAVDLRRPALRRSASCG